MSKVERIEITNGDFSIENFVSEVADFRYSSPSFDKGEDITFRLTDEQAADLRALLDVYLKSRED